MFEGTVKFRARIVDRERGLIIPQTCQFNPKETGVEKLEIKCPNGTEIVTVVHFTAVDSEERGISIATQFQKSIFDRLSIYRGIAIENGWAESNLHPKDRQTNVITPRTGDLVVAGDRTKVSLSLPCADLIPILEEAAPKGERYFGLYRSARLSISPVEEFMALYSILLMLSHDRKEEVDAFILNEDPSVPSMPRPTPLRKAKNDDLRRCTHGSEMFLLTIQKISTKRKQK
jgi:hypothetical protein